MRVLSDSDYKLFERLVSLSQKELKKAMSQYLKAKYDNVIFTKDYLVAIGDIPVALVAHLDTVYRTPVSNLYYDQRKGVLWSPDGLGADDRAGIFAVLKILQDGYRPSIIFTTDEETGMVGANHLDTSVLKSKRMINIDSEEDDTMTVSCAGGADFLATFNFHRETVNGTEIELILKGLKSKYEAHHKVEITDGAIESAVKLSSRYITDRFLPDKAIDLIDEAASRAALSSPELNEKKKNMKI